MQTRSYPEREGLQVWLNQKEQQLLLDHYDDSHPRRRICFELGLHGLRSEEIKNVQYDHFRDVGDNKWVLDVPQGKSPWRSVPVSSALQVRCKYLKSGARLRRNESLIDAAKRTMRSWIYQARENLFEETGNETWEDVGLHDLRRTWATETYYTLAYSGVPNAEQLTMSWGGWKMNKTGMESFREKYLGPIPDNVTAEAMELLNKSTRPDPLALAPEDN